MEAGAEFQASLIYVMSSRPTIGYIETLSQEKKKKGILHEEGLLSPRDLTVCCHWLCTEELLASEKTKKASEAASGSSTHIQSLSGNAFLSPQVSMVLTS